MSDGTAFSATSRIEALLDANSFVELGAAVTARSTDFNVSAEKTPSDGVVTGHGTIDGNLVFVFAQEPAVFGGAIGEMHAKKILSVYDRALKMGAPVIGVLDSTGVRLQESVDAVESLGAVLAKASEASGVIPQIMAVYGNCGGGLSVLTALADFTYMTDSAKLFFNSPSTLPGNKDVATDSAQFQSEEAGVVDFIGSEAEVSEQIRKLVTILPGSNLEEGCIDECTDDLNRAAEGVAASYEDAAAVFTELSDNRVFTEVKKAYAPAMTCGFIKLNGMTVGAIGNTVKKDGEDIEARLTADGLTKAADFVKFCDAFDLPILSLVKTEGYETSVCAERRLARAAASFTAAYASASVPKITLVANAYTTAYLLMGASSMGADLVYALSDADMGVLEAKAAAKILDSTPSEVASKVNGVSNAARHGYIDRVVNGADARKYLIAGYEMLYTKKIDEAYRKHSTK